MTFERGEPFLNKNLKAILVLLIALIVVFLMFLANNIKLLKKNTNSTFQNIIGVIVICFCLLLCYRSIIKVFIQ